MEDVRTKHSHHSPTKWLALLHESILSTRCRRNGTLVSSEEALETLIQLLREIKLENRQIWWVGNGGSSSICAHLSQDCVNKLNLRSNSLTDASLLTCMANDYGYENIYSRPLETLAEEGDLLIAISSSGNSKNILNCVEVASSKKMRIVTLSSLSHKNKLSHYPSILSFFLPAELYGIAEVGHLALLHSAIECLALETFEGQL